MRKFVSIFILILLSTNLWGNNEIPWASDTIAEKKGFLKRLGMKLERLNAIDTNYIEPQHYNFTIMAQSTMTYEIYRLRSKSGQSILFAPENSIKVGPFFGWQWVFLGYTFDMGHIQNNMKKEWNLSIYSSMIGIDLFYRKTGNDYKIRTIDLGNKMNTNALKGIPFSGLNVGIKGFNVYYIFNHKRFSYPAAFSQSTCQKRSAGSALIGIGYTRHTLDLDYEDLQRIFETYIPDYNEKLDSGLMFNKVKYTDFSLSGGYAYNWVFAKNWMFAASLSLAVSYKRATGDLQKEHSLLRDFSFNNLSLDGVGRFGMVWNNTKWYGGASAILHAYNYHKPQFRTNNFFGNVNIYFGLNLGKKKHYKIKDNK